jgi:SAM-dependent methyltransferase
MSSLVWDDVWKHSLSPDIRWFAEEFLHYLVNWSLDTQYLLFLEPGAGSGRFSYYLARRAREVVALDLSRNSVLAMRNLKPTGSGLLHVIRADILHMPFRDCAFDVVYNEGVVEHFPEPYRVLYEMVRVTRRLGLVIFSVPNVYSFHTLGKLMSSGSISISKPYGFERSFSNNQIKSMLQLLSLKDIEAHGIGLFYGIARYMPFPIYNVLYRAYTKFRRIKLGVLLTEFAGFHIIGKGEKG